MSFYIDLVVWLGGVGWWQVACLMDHSHLSILLPRCCGLPFPRWRGYSLIWVRTGGKCYNLALFSAQFDYFPISPLPSFTCCVFVMENRLTLTAEIDSSTRQNVSCWSLPPTDQLASYLHCYTTGISLQGVYSDTHQQNLNGSFSPVNMGREERGKGLHRGAGKSSLE